MAKRRAKRKRKKGPAPENKMRARAPENKAGCVYVPPGIQEMLARLQRDEDLGIVAVAVARV